MSELVRAIEQCYTHPGEHRVTTNYKEAFNDLGEKFDLLTADNADLRAQLDAWHTSFGTTQLTHAVSELEQVKSHLEKEEARCASKNAMLQKVFEMRCDDDVDWKDLSAAELLEAMDDHDKGWLRKTLDDAKASKANRLSPDDVKALREENAELKARVSELDSECEAQQYQFDILKKDPACVWANMLRGNIATPSALVEAHDYQQIKAENADLRVKLEEAESTHTEVVAKQLALRAEAEAKCAEMERAFKAISLVEWNEENAQDYWWQMHDLAAQAIAEPCGYGYRSPEDYAALEAKVKMLRELMSFFRCETCNGKGLFTFECQGCLTGEGECTCANEQPSPCPQCQMIPDIKVKYDALEKCISETGGEK